MSAPELSAETVVDGRYRLVQRLGSGGMADVWCAEDLQLGRRVALKLLHRRFAEDAAFVERFHREASSAAGLQHPNVVGVYDRGEWDGTQYIAMEHVEGEPLKQVIRRDGPLAPEHAAEIAVQILRAARFAHRRGIVHRDLKPHNVMIDGEGRAKVTDFGIARAGASDMTETGSIMGTAQYLSPEQAQGHAVSAQSDIYSVGVVLYEMLTGRVPFEADSAVSIALKQVTEAPEPPSRANPAVTPELEAVVLKALAKDPAARWEDADAFAAALEAAVTPGVHGTATTAFQPVPVVSGTVVERDVVVEEEVPPDERRRPWWVWALGLLLLALLVAGLLLLLDGGEERAVPQVVGADVAPASRALREAGFEPAVDPVRNPAPAGRVIGQDPGAGTRLEEGSRVTLVVSQGPGTRAVPDVAGEAEAAARRELRDAGFRVRRRGRASSDVAAGVVISTTPPAGTQAAVGGDVTLVVSTGPVQVTVPDVVGDDQDTARAELEEAGLSVDVTTSETSASDPGTVIAQDPEGGATVDDGAGVTITVAEAPETAAVPEVVGLSQGGARRALRSAGFAVAVAEEETSEPGEDGQVLGQSPDGGAEAEAGTTITITVGRFTGLDDETDPEPDPDADPADPADPATGGLGGGDAGARL